MIGRGRGLRRGLASLALVSGVLVSGILMLAGSSASAQDHRQNAPGAFDFYVLSLSWSPSFCEAARERGSNGRGTQAQCGGRPYSFVVHGLWPQYERGYPEYCQRPSPRLDRNVMRSMLDLMPAPGLIYSEWDKHGTCAGLGARAYIETIRKARAAVKNPEQYLGLAERGGGRLHQGLSGPQRLRHRRALRQPQARRSADLHEQGFAVPRLRAGRPQCLPPQPDRDAADARRLAAYSDISAASPRRRGPRLSVRGDCQKKFWRRSGMRKSAVMGPRLRGDGIVGPVNPHCVSFLRAMP